MRAKLGSAVPGEVLPSIDLEAIKASAIRRANDEVPERIKAMTAEQCRAELAKQFPIMRAWQIEREPGQDDDEREVAA